MEARARNLGIILKKVNAGDASSTTPASGLDRKPGLVILEKVA
jgi:hypothetical protein